MNKSARRVYRGRLGLMAVALSSACLLPVLSSTNADADTPSPTTATPSPSQTHVSTSPTHSPERKHGPAEQQKIALAAAKSAYQSAVKSALDGANKAIADARSIRDQALAAAGKDANVRKLANSDFLNSSSQIWSAFRASVAAAKAAYDEQLLTIKNSNTPVSK